MTTNEMFDRMCQMLPYVVSIINDTEILNVQKKIKEKVGHGELLNDLYPMILTRHRNELYALLGIVAGKTAEEVANDPYSETKKLLESGFWSDFFDFFPLFLHMAAKA